MNFMMGESQLVKKIIYFFKNKINIYYIKPTYHKVGFLFLVIFFAYN